MYEQHFGFSRPLFTDGVPQDDAVFRTKAGEDLTRDLAVALSRRDSVVVLAGPSGTGKTTLAADALKGVGTRLAFGCISSPPLTPHELLEQLLIDFGFEPYRASRMERLQLWRQFLAEMTATDTRVCLLVEASENLSTEVLKSLHTLTVADAALSPGGNVLLTTALPPESLLVAPELMALNQRVRLRRWIEPLTETELEAYLEFKCRLGGVPRPEVLADDAASTLYEYSGGILRVVDSLLETALLAAATNDERPVSSESIATLAEAQFGIARMSPVEVDDLLGGGMRESGDESASDDEPPYPEDIPTLTECVSA